VDSGILKIADFPGTLFSLLRFVKIKFGQKRAKKLKKYYESFNEKLSDLLEDSRRVYVLRNVKIELL